MTQPDDNEYTAILENDGSFDKQFLYGVKTTKIFCMPSCPSPNPLRQNVVIFKRISEAEAHGYRACLRCKPALNDQKLGVTKKTALKY